MKSMYIAPQLTVYGDVEDLTMTGHQGSQKVFGADDRHASGSPKQGNDDTPPPPCSGS